jgi:hypothetical protein
LGIATSEFLAWLNSQDQRQVFVFHGDLLMFQ